ncbi:prepilin peptidase [Fusibacter sp. 3D3]|uniref:A24 family peptidase n=1 Tax=Fusibacter sp. 3D3 TaxID=1048380 RepID=UPI000858CC34|nr:prepilin peptidase [Fusibacter sp. 3D3]GAU76341.1 type IV prepilin peptidase TadV/CpaA [Fusibacter sp. 3D3]
MQLLEVIPKCLLVALVAIAIITDIKSRRINNKLILVGILSGICFSVGIRGLTGIIYSGSGFIFGFVLMIVPFLLGYLGGGDVKLLMMIGCFLGFSAILNVYIYMAIAGGVFSFAVMIKTGELKRSLIKIKNQIVCLIYQGNIEGIANETPLVQSSIPYALPIGIGLIWYWVCGPILNTVL